MSIFQYYIANDTLISTRSDSGFKKEKEYILATACLSNLNTQTIFVICLFFNPLVFTIMKFSNLPGQECYFL